MERYRIRKGADFTVSELILKLLSRFSFFFLRVSGAQNFPDPLSPGEEAKCFADMKNGDKEARNRLIVHNLRLVAHIVKKYYANASDQDDIMSIGTVGLIKAVDSFRPESGVRFATYAGKCLQNEILMYFRSRKKYSGEISLNEPVETDKNGNLLTYADLISVDDTIAEDLDLKLRSERAGKLILTALTARERKILILRYGLRGDEPMTQREIAKKLGISRSYVSRIEKAALEKLREGMKSPGF
ncbi:MAG: RNA polymerase sporulation sigma factor SigK [Lachnospiraceae bacterium]|nr:RNA polymerase sporulation sigma factor SigK [Lachnospiraceae bacterium]